MEALTRVYALPYPPTSAGHVNDRPFYRWAGTSPPLGASGSGCAGSGLWGEHEERIRLRDLIAPRVATSSGRSGKRRLIRVRHAVGEDVGRAGGFALKLRGHGGAHGPEHQALLALEAVVVEVVQAEGERARV